MAKVNLLDFDLAAMQSYFASLNEPSYRASQVIKWIHYFGVCDFAQMTNLSKSLRSALSANCEIRLPSIHSHQQSTDGTRKWLLKLDCGNCIETVFIPEAERGTLCVSSQIGCALNCSFCETGKQGFNRNLTTAEIIGQVWVAVRELSLDGGKHDRQISNVVMMGMGEPLLNYEPVLAAMNLMQDDFAYMLSKKRVTLSTSGVLPALKKLQQDSDVSLAVSLHAANDALRDILVPINKKYPIDELLAVCHQYFPEDSRRAVTYEYVMLRDVNDSDADAKQLVSLLKNKPAKVNLIPFNPIPGANYECSTMQRINSFRDILVKNGIVTITRKTRGDDIAAACGQLAGRVKDRTSRSRRLASIPVIIEEPISC